MGARTTKPRLLDLFCGAGGASAGYWQAGFDVTGVDIRPQPRYPFQFVQADALEYIERPDFRSFDVIHASPPCQRYSTMTKRWGREDEHVDLIAQLRAYLMFSDAPAVIENVPGSPLRKPIMLCGSMFGLGVRRHRMFESNVPLGQPKCDHAGQGRVVGVYGHSGGSSKRDGLSFGGVQSWREAMQIDWMTRDELAQSIPPAYTRFIGEQLCH